MGKVKIIKYSISTLLNRLAATDKQKVILVEKYVDSALNSLGKKLGETVINGRKTYKSLDEICITMEQLMDEIRAMKYWPYVKQAWEDVCDVLF
ncbi:hypothetical protein H8356DRAFT_965418 [Neocallimastix lanati (nom. inval.)]|nr:hypothetical protein H8356DRAFT_965418 [Neocallimastix sp. JGI-2020a]